MPLSSADIKRQILMSADKSEFKRKIQENLPGIDEGEMIEIGNQLEAVTKTKGWILVESFMIRRMNIVGLIYADKTDPDQKGIAKGYMDLMQWIELSIQTKNEILSKEKVKHETKDVPKNETE